MAPSVGGGAPTGQAQLAPRADVGFEPAAAHFVRCIVTAAADVDPRGLQAQLDLAASVLGLSRCLDDVVLPAARQLRLLQAQGHADKPAHLMAVEAIRTWINQRALFAPTPVDDVGPILLACGAREPHPIALESMALLLRFHRWPCQVLGTRVSTFTLTIAAQAADAAGVIVVSTDNRGLPRATVLLRAADALGVPVFFAGDSFEPEPRRRQLPGLYLGTDIGRAIALLRASLTPGRPLRATTSRRRSFDADAQLLSRTNGFPAAN